MTPVTKRRKGAPGSLTAADVAAFFKRRRFPRDVRTVGAFERAAFVKPSDRFFELYAEAIGSDVGTVRADYARTRLMRERRSGPFVRLNRVA